jgi:hypothetical protein
MNSDAIIEQQDLAKLTVIKFNQKSYGSWTKARDAYRSVSKNATVTSVWNMVYAEPTTTTSRSSSNARTAIKIAI